MPRASEIFKWLCVNNNESLQYTLGAIRVSGGGWSFYSDCEAALSPGNSDGDIDSVFGLPETAEFDEAQTEEIVRSFSPEPTSGAALFHQRHVATCGRLLLHPAKRRICLRPEVAVANFSYAALYTGALSSFGLREEITCEAVLVGLRVHLGNAPVLLVSAEQNFLHNKQRLELALGLLHGSPLQQVLQATPDEVIFFGWPTNPSGNAMSMVHASSPMKQALSALVDAFVLMPDENFRRERLACLFHLQGKSNAAPLEIRYLMHMMAVEMWDEVGSLQDITTSEMLGLQEPEGKLINVMRHKLVHGSGGYKDAYLTAVKDRFDGEVPVVRTDFCGPLDKSNVDFAQLYLRLVERLDAFVWGRYGLAENMSPDHSQMHRKSVRVASVVSLWPLPTPYNPRPLAKKPDSQGGEHAQIEECRQKNSILLIKNQCLKEQLKKQGKVIDRLKAENQKLKEPNAPSA